MKKIILGLLLTTSVFAGQNLELTIENQGGYSRYVDSVDRSFMPVVDISYSFDWTKNVYGIVGISFGSGFNENSSIQYDQDVTIYNYEG